MARKAGDTVLAWMPECGPDPPAWYDCTYVGRKPDGRHEVIRKRDGKRLMAEEIR
jgi:hypothetical protein